MYLVDFRFTIDPDNDPLHETQRVMVKSSEIQKENGIPKLKDNVSLLRAAQKVMARHRDKIIAIDGYSIEKASWIDRFVFLVRGPR